jgi:hypothetical protein
VKLGTESERRGRNECIWELAAEKNILAYAGGREMRMEKMYSEKLLEL